MTLIEAKAIAKIVETAEGGCGGCVNEAVKELNKMFPEFIWNVKGLDGYDATIEVFRKTIANPKPEPYRRTGCR